ncbi:MAG: glycosyltransferase family 4 protein [Mucilaginibacter sp.]|uniref:glycosyltransferase n=1 Tax=Mucilaginibacter sp. TaxID=1882438 RepID=UPI002601D5C5|nr:glycosyltransferase [Mucilaginibacter sp.]MDB5005125.1 glycosyltransferase family 4 protein [Mucilaginibacter sp.]
MPKILRILNRLNVGGPTLNVAYLSGYIENNYQTKVLAGHKEPYEGSSEYVLNDLNIGYDYVPDMYRSINLVKDYRAFKYIQSAIKNYQPDIVHTHAAKAGVLGRLAAYHNSKRPRAILHTYHGNVFDGYFSPVKTKIFLGIERYLASISSAIIAISDEQKNDLVNKYKIAPENKVHVIRLGFDLDRFAQNTDQKRHEFRSFYNIQEEEIVITITGRLTAIKNHYLFIAALQMLKQQKPTLKFKAFIVGDGELMEPIINMIKESGLSFCRADNNNYQADIIFTSWRKDIDIINSGSDIAALTSLNEGTPVSIIEAMASQKAVICTNVGGVKDVVKDGYSGFLCDQTPESFVSKLIKLIEDKGLRNKMAINGQIFVFENYSYQRLVKETENLYNNLLN